MKGHNYWNPNRSVNLCISVDPNHQPPPRRLRCKDVIQLLLTGWWQSSSLHYHYNPRTIEGKERIFAYLLANAKFTSKLIRKRKRKNASILRTLFYFRSISYTNISCWPFWIKNGNPGWTFWVISLKCGLWRTQERIAMPLLADCSLCESCTGKFTSNAPQIFQRLASINYSTRNVSSSAWQQIVIGSPPSPGRLHLQSWQVLVGPPHWP